jgi:DNA-binding response OmpR family regulator
MNKLNNPLNAEPNPTRTITVLSISPIKDDHSALKRIFTNPKRSVYTDSEWVLQPVLTLKAALPLLRDNPIPIVLSERDLLPGTWREVLAELVTLPDPPLLIVSSRNADEYLWAEALNLGAYDVLAKPFDVEEVVRVLSVAWMRWKRESEVQRNRRAAAA